MKAQAYQQFHIEESVLSLSVIIAAVASIVWLFQMPAALIPTVSAFIVLSRTKKKPV